MLQHRRRKKQLPTASSSQLQWQQSSVLQQQLVANTAAQVSQQQQQSRQSTTGVSATPAAATAPHHGRIRSVELLRGRSGFGFTVNGHRPCLLSCIVPGSSADTAGLHEGDQLLAVNGTAAAQLSHDRVVRLIAAGGNAIKLLVADGARRRSSSAVGVGAGALVDTSDEDDWEEAVAGCDNRETQYNRPYRTPRRRQRSQPPAKSGSAGRTRSVSPTTVGLQLHGELPEASVQAAENRASYLSATAARAARAGLLRDQGRQPVDVSRGSAAKTGYDNSSRSRTVLLPRSTSVPDVSSEAGGDGALFGRRPHPKDGVFAVDATGLTAAASTARQPVPSFFLRAIVGYIGTIEVPQTLARRGGPAPGCAGSVLVSQLQAGTRSAVRRLRIEQRVHTFVSLSVKSDGVHLHGPGGGLVAHYPRQSLTFCGTYCDDERFFSLVTEPDCCAPSPDDRDLRLGRIASHGHRGIGAEPLKMEEEEEEEESGSSCHVFMVDPALSLHSAHAKVAVQFGNLSCDPSNTVGCAEFPRSCSAILEAVSSLFRVSSSGSCMAVNSSWTSRKSPLSDGPVGRSQSACPFVASSGDTDSDSGLGRHRRRTAKGVSPSRAYVVSVDVPAGDGRVTEPAAAASASTTKSPSLYADVNAGRPSSRPGVAAAAAGSLLSAAPVGDRDGTAWPKAAIGNDTQRQRTTRTPLATHRAASDASSGGSDRSGIGDSIRMSCRPARPTDRYAAALEAGVRASSSTAVSPAVFNIRAKTDDSPLSQRSSADSLRRNMHRLMEARRTTLVRDTHSLSDTESLASVRSSGAGSFVPATTVSSPGNSDSSRAASSSTTGRSEASRELPAVPPAPASASWRQPSAAGVAVGVMPGNRHLSSSCETLSASVVPASLRESADVCVRSAAGNARASAAAVSTAIPGSLQQQQQQQQRDQQELQHRRGEAVEGRHHSKLSPRAYPELAAAIRQRTPSVVQLSECSAFDKVAVLDNSCLASSTACLTASAASMHPAETPKPVPAPRAAGVPLSAGGRRVTATSSAAEAAASAAAVSAAPAKQVDTRCRSVPVVAAVALSGSRVAIQRGRQAMPAASVGHPKLHSALIRLSKRWAQVGGSLRRPRLRRTELAYAESLIDPRDGNSSVGISCGSSMGVTDGSSNLSLASENIGRVTRWALGLDKLLQDDSGIAVFTDFLRKEHSEENMAFWLACEKFRRAPQQSKLELAKEIFHTYLSPRGSQAVNVDSTAQQYSEEQLAQPTDDMFDEAQKQVFQLMKMDCYARFLKSDLYKSCIVAEMEEHRLTDKGLRAATMDSKTARDDASEEGSDVSETRRRRSLMFFLKDSAKTLTRNADPLSRSRSSDVGYLNKKQVAKQRTDQQADAPRPAQHRLGLAATGVDSRSIREQDDVMIVQSSGEDDAPASTKDGGSDSRKSATSGTPRDWRSSEVQQPRRSRRFVLPDGSAVDVGMNAESDTMRSIVERLCADHGIALTSVEVLTVGSDKPLDLSKKLSEMDPGADFIMERRAVFKLDLPRRRTIAVRAKPQRLVGGVLRQVLYKYGYNIENLSLYLDDSSVLSPDAIVSAVDGRRISVRELSDSTELGRRVKARPLLSITSYSVMNSSRVDGSERSDESSSDRYNSGSEASSVEDIVDFEKTPFEDRVRGVGSSGGGLLSRLRPPSAADERSQRTKGKSKVRFAPTSGLVPPTVANGSHVSKSDDNGLLDLITRAQCSQYDDQRGATVSVGELPAFLLQPNSDQRGREDANSRDIGDVGSSCTTPDGNRGTATSKLPHSMRPVPRTRTPGQRLAPSTHDITFSEDGQVPVHETAEALLTTSRSCMSVTPAHNRSQGPRFAQNERLDDDTDEDDDCTPTRQSQSISYRAEILQLSVVADNEVDSERRSDNRPAAADRSWYRPQWDDRIGEMDDDDEEEECETEASSTGNGEPEDDSGASATATFDPDKTLTAGEGDMSSGDMSVSGLGSYLPPPSPFENVKEPTSRDAAVTAPQPPPASSVERPASTRPVAAGRPSLPPPYGVAVERLMSLAAVASASPSSAVVRSAVAMAPSATSAARSPRSSTLPGSRLSYASGPLIVDDDSGDDDAALLVGSGTGVDVATVQSGGEAVLADSSTRTAPATGRNGGSAVGSNIPKLQFSTSSSNSSRPQPAAGSSTALLPQQRFGFYHSVVGAPQQQLNLSRGGQQPSFGVTVPNSGSKITFV